MRRKLLSIKARFHVEHAKVSVGCGTLVRNTDSVIIGQGCLFDLGYLKVDENHLVGQSLHLP